VIFAADLIRRLPMPLEIEFVKARSYRGSEQREVEILDDVGQLGLTGRHVLLADCVLDSGRTVAALQRRVAACRPASLKTCVLLSKQRPRAAEVEVDYVGLEIPDVFVVGYGLDHNGCWRHLPYLGEHAESTGGGP
jgi:hypoxanthine phosphoribosyltransferase